MKKIIRNIDIKAPAQRIYDFITQPANLPGIWPSLISVSNVVPSIGGAHDFDWVYKMGGIHFKGRSKTEDAQPGKHLRIRNEKGIPSTFRWSFQGQDGSGTKLMLDIEYEIPVPIVGKIAEALLDKLNERDADAMLANLKDTMEHAATAAPFAHP